MTSIYTIADLINTALVCHRYANQNNRHCVCFDGSEVKDGSALIGETGNGKSYAEALADYANKIKGKTIVLDAYRDTRREFVMPNDLSA